MPDLVLTLTEVQAAAEAVRASEAVLDRDRQRLTNAVEAARAAGATLAQIGDVSGYSRQRIAQLLQRP